MAHVDMDSGWVKAATIATDKPLRHVVEDIADDMRHAVPVDTGDLHDTIHTSFPETGKGRAHAGGELHGRLIDYWADVEYGTHPHMIRSRGPWPLRNRETGEVFGRVVNHPGTPAQPYMRPALYRHRDLA